jgi:hypothetical protein
MTEKTEAFPNYANAQPNCSFSLNPRFLPVYIYIYIYKYLYIYIYTYIYIYL